MLAVRNLFEKAAKAQATAAAQAALAAAQAAALATALATAALEAAARATAALEAAALATAQAAALAELRKCYLKLEEAGKSNNGEIARLNIGLHIATTKCWNLRIDQAKITACAEKSKKSKIFDKLATWSIWLKRTTHRTGGTNSAKVMPRRPQA